MHFPQRKIVCSTLIKVTLNLILNSQCRNELTFVVWLGAKQVTSHYLNQWRSITLTHICISKPQSISTLANHFILNSYMQMLWHHLSKQEIKKLLTLETDPWKSAILPPSMLPNLESTSLCHESYFRVTLDWTWAGNNNHMKRTIPTTISTLKRTFYIAQCLQSEVIPTLPNSMQIGPNSCFVSEVSNVLRDCLK